MIRAKINGIDGEFADGITVLAAARELGFSIPTLCNDDRLDPVGACRMCLVEIRLRSFGIFWSGSINAKPAAC